MSEYNPVTEKAKKLKKQVSPERWDKIVREARKRVALVQSVKACHESRSLSWRNCLLEVDSELHWGTYLHWRRRLENRTGPLLERVLDERVPPIYRIPDTVRQAAIMIRRMDRSVNTQKAREKLREQFGDSGIVSDSVLHRLWADADLKHLPKTKERPEKKTPSSSDEEVVHYNGGGGLAMLVAADSETKTLETLASTILKVGQAQADQQEVVDVYVEKAGERDALGQFTGVYNHNWRVEAESGTADGRWVSDAIKREERQLSELVILKNQVSTLSSKLFCMGVVPLLTEKRGFAGLEGPSGNWLGLLSSVPYMPATLSKVLAELSLLDVNYALWGAHGQKWSELSKRWSGQGPHWLRCAIYIDSTQDEYWTRYFASSSKVSRANCVMPCLSRAVITSGPGVPLFVETFAGSLSLRSGLLPLLDKFDQAVGDSEIGRLIIIDSEMGTGNLMTPLSQTKNRKFISVLKGKILQNSKVEANGEFEPYRKRDRVRELKVTVNGKGTPEGGLSLRGVEMTRPDSRHPRPTIFVTNSSIDWLSTVDVPMAYLSRWPNQEQIFRNLRNGGGLNRSHGYGGEFVQNVALETKLEQAERRVKKTKRELDNILELEEKIKAIPSNNTESLKIVQKDIRRAKKDIKNAEKKLEKQQTAPRQIYSRDTNRDNLMSCLKLTIMLLIEFVLKEYFNGLKIEWRTFIEHFVMLPVTVRTSPVRVLYQIHFNPRQPKRMEALRLACDEINRRKIQKKGQLLVFEVIEPP